MNELINLLIETAKKRINTEQESGISAETLELLDRIARLAVYM